MFAVWIAPILAFAINPKHEQFVPILAFRTLFHPVIIRYLRFNDNMNILEAFYFMFEADTSGVKKGTDEGEASAKKLKKAVDDVDLSADKLAANFVNMAKNAASALAGVLALGAIKTLVNDTAAHTTAVALQARAMNMSVEQLSAYRAAIIGMGGSEEQATQTLERLRDGFVEVARFGTMGVTPMTMAFQQLGASAQTMHDAIKDPTIALSAIADNFSKLNRTQQLFLGQKLGLDQGTIMLLAQGRRSFDELIAKERELHAVTEEQARASMKYTIAQKELNLTYEATKRSIAQELLPAFTWVIQGIDKIVTWLMEHKAVAIGVFAAIGAVIATALVPPLVSAAAAMWALIAPALLMAAPFIALGLVIGLVIDDIEKFRAGQASLIGEILARWPIIGQIARAIAEIVGMSWKLIVDAFKWLGGVIANEGVAVWNGYKAAVTNMVDTLVKAFPVLGQIFKSVSDGIKFEIDGLNKVFQFWVDLIEKAWGLIKHAPQAVLNWIGHKLSAVTGEKYDDIGGPDNPQLTPAATARLGSNTATGRQIADELVGMGWTQEQAAGIAGSFMQESGGNADAKNKSSGAYGLGQWLGTRRKDFEQWAGHPLEGSTLDEQLRFFQYEVTNGKEQSAGRRLRATTTAEEAAAVHSKYYERPGSAEANVARRQDFAEQIYAARGQVQAADSAPLAQPGATSNTTNNARNSTTTVQVGDIHVHAAPDPQATGQAVHNVLKQHINNAIDQHDDGIAG